MRTLQQFPTADHRLACPGDELDPQLPVGRNSEVTSDRPPHPTASGADRATDRRPPAAIAGWPSRLGIRRPPPAQLPPSGRSEPRARSLESSTRAHTIRGEGPRWSPAGARLSPRPEPPSAGCHRPAGHGVPRNRKWDCHWGWGGASRWGHEQQLTVVGNAGWEAGQQGIGGGSCFQSGWQRQQYGEQLLTRFPDRARENRWVWQARHPVHFQSFGMCCERSPESLWGSGVW